MCDVYGILRETEKAVYAMLVLGSEKCKTTWNPKSVLIEKEVGYENGLYNHETLFFDNYEEMRREFLLIGELINFHFLKADYWLKAL